MKKLGLLSMMLLAACGSSSKPAAEPVEPMSDPAMSGTAGQRAAAGEDDETMGSKPALPTSDVAATTDAEAAAAAAAAEPPPRPTAEAHLVSVKDGAAMGHISFELHDGEISMAGAFNNLPPGPHAFYIHEKGDCSKKGTLVGKHLDPTKAKHGPPSSSTRHAGDLGDLVADADGNATFQMTTNSVTMEDGRPDSIVRRAIVIHAKKDDKKGSGGPAIACGIIEMAGGDAQQAATP